MEQVKKQPEAYLSQDQTGVNTTEATETHGEKEQTQIQKQPEEFLSQDQSGVNSVSIPESEDPNYVAENSLPVAETTFAEDRVGEQHKEERPLIKQDRPLK